MLTKKLLTKTKRGASVSDRVPSLIASIFSVVFALSVVNQLSEIVEGYVLGLLIVFTVLFLILNEKIKVQQIQRMYSGKWKAIPLFFATFAISVFLSCIGIYFWTNKSLEISTSAENTTVQKELEIRKDYQNRISRFANQEFKYDDTQLEYWKSRRPANLEERNEIRKQITKLEAERESQRIAFNERKEKEIQRLTDLMNVELRAVSVAHTGTIKELNRADLVSWIFLAMILLTEFVIIILNGQIARKEKDIEYLKGNEIVQNFLIGRSILTSLLLHQKPDGEVNIQQAKYSGLTEDWARIKRIYNLMMHIGILKDERIKDNIVYNTVALSEKEAYYKFDNYFEKIFEIKL